MREHSSRQVYVLAGYSEQNRLTQATFVWEVGAIDVYRAPVSPDVVVGFDGHFPVFPSNLAVHDQANGADYELISELFGSDMNELIDTARQQGITSARLALSGSSRQALARLQLQALTTPERLRNTITQYLPRETADTLDY